VVIHVLEDIHREPYVKFSLRNRHKGVTVAQTEKDQTNQEQKSAQELNSFTELVLSLSMRCDANVRDSKKPTKKQART